MDFFGLEIGKEYSKYNFCGEDIPETARFVVCNIRLAERGYESVEGSDVEFSIKEIRTNDFSRCKRVSWFYKKQAFSSMYFKCVKL